MGKLLKHITIGFKGACMGAADVIPGVSGGTIAFIMGIYDEFVGSIASINKANISLLLKGEFKEFWKNINGSFLLSLVIGIGVSVVCLAGIMENLLSTHPIQTWAFFFGLIVASSIFILKGISGWNTKGYLMLATGIVLGVLVCTLSPTQTPEGLWFIFISGAIAICAMILPGISGSFILLILGKYKYIMGCISDLVAGVNFWNNLVIMGVFVVGAVLGILSFSKLLHWLLSRWNKETLIVLAGFIIGSLVKVWPWSDMETIICSQVPEVAKVLGNSDVGTLSAEMIDQYRGVVDLHIVGAIIFAVVGFSLVSAIEIAGKKFSSKTGAKTN